MTVQTDDKNTTLCLHACLKNTVYAQNNLKLEHVTCYINIIERMLLES